MTKEFRSKGDSSEKKTHQLLDSLEIVLGDWDLFYLRSLGVREAILKKTPQLLDSLEIVYG